MFAQILFVEREVARKGEKLRAGLRDLAATRPEFGAVRGIGLLDGVEYSGDLAALLKTLRADGLLAARAGANVLRLIPPLNVTDDEIEIALGKIAKAVPTK